MMKVKKALAVITAAATVLTVLASCSSGGAQGSVGGSAPGAESSGGVKHLTLWAGWTGDSATQLNQQVAAFNKANSGIQVEYAVQQNMEQKLLTTIAGGSGMPDILVWDRFNTPVYASKGALMDLSDYVSKDKVDLAQFYNEAVKEMTYNGKLYGIPMDVDNRSLFYNKKMFQEAGIANPPTNWSELEEDAKKLTVWKDGKLVRAGMDLSDCGLFSMWLMQAGGKMVSDDGKKTAFNDEHGLTVLNFWHKLVYDDKVYVNGFTQGLAQGEDPFVTGKIAMKYDGPWDLSTFKKYGNDLDFGVVPPPAGPNGDKGSGIGGFALAIPTKAADPDASFEFIKWWTTVPENGINFAKISGNIPANKEAANDSYFVDDEYYKAFVETMDFAKIRPQATGYSDVEGKATIPDLQLFMQNKMTAQQALSDAQQKGDQILQQAAQQQ